jgi:hypothetical protein
MKLSSESLTPSSPKPFACTNNNRHITGSRRCRHACRGGNSKPGCWPPFRLKFHARLAVVRSTKLKQFVTSPCPTSCPLLGLSTCGTSLLCGRAQKDQTNICCRHREAFILPPRTDPSAVIQGSWRTKMGRFPPYTQLDTIALHRHRDTRWRFM